MRNYVYDELLEQIDSYILNTLAHSSLTPIEIAKSLDGFLERYHISLASINNRLNELQLDCQIACICPEPQPDRSFFSLRIPVDDLPMFHLDDSMIDELCNSLNLYIGNTTNDKIYLTGDEVDGKPVLHIFEDELVIFEIDTDDEEIIGDLHNIETNSVDEAQDSLMDSAQQEVEIDEDVEESREALPEEEIQDQDFMQSTDSDSLDADGSVFTEADTDIIVTDNDRDNESSYDSDVTTEQDNADDIDDDVQQSYAPIEDYVNTNAVPTESDNSTDTDDASFEEVVSYIDEPSYDDKEDSQDTISEQTLFESTTDETYDQNSQDIDDSFEHSTDNESDIIAPEDVFAESDVNEEYSSQQGEADDTSAANIGDNDIDSAEKEVKDFSASDVDSIESQSDYFEEDVAADDATFDSSVDAEEDASEEPDSASEDEFIAETNDESAIDHEEAAYSNQSDEDISTQQEDIALINETVINFAADVTDESPIETDNDNDQANDIPEGEKVEVNKHESYIDVSALLSTTESQRHDEDNDENGAKTHASSKESIEVQPQAEKSEDPNVYEDKPYSYEELPSFRDEDDAEDNDSSIDTRFASRETKSHKAQKSGPRVIGDDIVDAFEIYDNIQNQEKPTKRTAFSPADIQKELEENPEMQEKRLASMRLLGLISDDKSEEAPTEEVEEEAPAIEEVEPTPPKTSYSAVLTPQDELDIYLQAEETEQRYSYKAILHKLFNTSSAPKEEETTDDKITMEECTSMSDFREEMRKKGYDVRQYVVQHTVQYYSQKYINVNSIRFATSCISYLIALIMIVVGYFTCEQYAALGYVPYLCTGIALFLVPAYCGIRYMAYKDKHAPATFSFKLSFATSLMSALILMMVFLLIAFFSPKSGANISEINTLIGPVFYPAVLLLLLPISVVVYALLYRTRKFYVI